MEEKIGILTDLCSKLHEQMEDAQAETAQKKISKDKKEREKHKTNEWIINQL